MTWAGSVAGRNCVKGRNLSCTRCIFPEIFAVAGSSFRGHAYLKTFRRDASVPNRHSFRTLPSSPTLYPHPLPARHPLSCRRCGLASGGPRLDLVVCRCPDCDLKHRGDENSGHGSLWSWGIRKEWGTGSRLLYGLGES